MNKRMKPYEAAVEATKRWSAAILAVRELREFAAEYPDITERSQTLFVDAPETSSIAFFVVKPSQTVPPERP